MILLMALAAMPAGAQELRLDDMTMLKNAVTTLQGQVERLQKQVGAMQTQLANQLCFSKATYGYALNVPGGNLSIAADTISVQTTGQLSLRGASTTMEATGMLEIKAAGTMTTHASLLSLNGGAIILNGGTQHALAYESVAPGVTWTGAGTTLPILLKPSQSTVLIP